MRLIHNGSSHTINDVAADVLQLTFKNVGDTPDNRYEVLVNRALGLVEEWAFYEQRTPSRAFARAGTATAGTEPCCWPRAARPTSWLSPTM